MILFGRGGYELLGPAITGEALEKLLYNAAKILRSRGYSSAASLLENYPFEILEATNDFGDDFCALNIDVEVEDYEELRRISSDEEGQYAFHNIAAVISEIGPYIRVVSATLVKEEPDLAWRRGRGTMEGATEKDKAKPKIDELIKQVTQQRDLMINVATGGERIQSVNREYEDRHKTIKASLAQFGISDPNPFMNLWNWYERWKKGDLPSYQDRRRFIYDLYDPLIAQVQGFGTALEETETTGWPRVDRGIFKIKRKLYSATAEEDYQGVGLLCREVIISLAQAVYDPEIHVTNGKIRPSDTDADEMLSAYIACELRGSANEEARRFCKASLTLALALQHKRTASFRDAALCAEATENLTSAIAIVSGRRKKIGPG
jgi:hypothetical protein